jgi:hypothetical protein
MSRRNRLLLLQIKERTKSNEWKPSKNARRTCHSKRVFQVSGHFGISAALVEQVQAIDFQALTVVAEPLPCRHGRFWHARAIHLYNIKTSTRGSHLAVGRKNKRAR